MSVKNFVTIRDICKVAWNPHFAISIYPFDQPIFYNRIKQKDPFQINETGLKLSNT
jgi:hypothetical protein